MEDMNDRKFDMPSVIDDFQLNDSIAMRLAIVFDSEGSKHHFDHHIFPSLLPLYFANNVTAIQIRVPLAIA
jgi:hypothetical protein